MFFVYSIHEIIKKKKEYYCLIKKSIFKTLRLTSFYMDSFSQSHFYSVHSYLGKLKFTITHCRTALHDFLILSPMSFLE